MQTLTRLREYRERHCLSQRELAKLAGLTYVAVHYLENGQRAPHRGTALKLARALGCTPWDLTRPLTPGSGREGA